MPKSQKIPHKRHERTPYWHWSANDWTDFFNSNPKREGDDKNTKQLPEPENRYGFGKDKSGLGGH